MKTILSISRSGPFKRDLERALSPEFNIQSLDFSFKTSFIRAAKPHLALVDGDTLPASGPIAIADLCKKINEKAGLPLVFSSTRSMSCFENLLIPGRIGFVSRPFLKSLLNQQIQTMLAFHKVNLRLESKKEKYALLKFSLSSLINNLTFDFWAMDSTLCYVYQNEHSIRKWGNVRGKKIDDLGISEELRTIWKNQILRSREGEVIRSEYMTREGDKEICFESTISPVMIEGENMGIIGITRDISGFKKAQENLKAQKVEIQEINTALKVLLRKRETDKSEAELEILSNLRTLVFPFLESVYKDASNTQKQALDQIRENLEAVCSSFSRDLKSMDLTGTEIQVANYICHGRTTKEIASLMGVAQSTINTHRSHIRNKIGIRNERVSLKSFLFSRYR